MSEARDGCWQERTSGDPLPIVLVAAAALVDVDGRVLIARRPEGKRTAGGVDLSLLAKSGFL